MAKYDVFISYSRKDSRIADQICEALDRAGITYFIDRKGIGGGMEFPKVLARAIKESTLFLYLASRNSYEAKFTNSEVTYAFNKKDRESIIPYIIDDSTLPEEQEFLFAGINWRNTKQHPIDTVLVNDFLTLLERFGVTKNRAATETSQNISQHQDTNKQKLGNLFQGIKQHVVSNVEKINKQKTTLQLSAEELFSKGYDADSKGNYDEAIKWYLQAASKEHIYAMYNLGIIYEYGKGVKADEAHALEWYGRAACNGYVEAQFKLGLMYDGGIGGNKDVIRSTYWFCRAAKRGHANAQFHLGFFYEDGKGGQRDIRKAVSWYSKSAEQGNMYAQCNLGVLYEYGNGVVQDYNLAVLWYRKAAGQGLAIAQRNLGVITTVH